MKPAWDDIEEGQAAPELVGAPLTITDFVRYQGASGDMNPIHHDAGFAQRAGYPGPFAVGMRQAGVLGVYATRWLGAADIRRLQVRFREQAWPGDVITYAGVVSAKREVGGERLVELRLTATRQTGGVHIEGEATFVVAD
jgi:acyl dehydratase